MMRHDVSAERRQSLRLRPASLPLHAARSAHGDAYLLSRTRPHQARAGWFGSFILAGVLAAAVTGCGGPRWEFEYNYGRHRAAAESKALLLYFTDPMSTERFHCEKQLFSDADVQREMAECVNVMLSYFWGPAPRVYGVTQPHWCVVCRSDGTEISRKAVNPVPPPGEFTGWLREARLRAAAPGTTQEGNATNVAP